VIVARVVNDKGRTFNVRLVRKGDRYGLNDCLVHDNDEPLVEFWDATYENDPRFTPGLGQFVSRYCLGILAGKDEDGYYGYGRGSAGLDLCGHVSEWKVTGENVVDAIAAVHAVLSEAHA
jgi:hypothetical protein